LSSRGDIAWKKICTEANRAEIKCIIILYIMNNLRRNGVEKNARLRYFPNLDGGRMAK
jgi:hypothetical protein